MNHIRLWLDYITAVYSLFGNVFCLEENRRVFGIVQKWGLDTIFLMFLVQLEAKGKVILSEKRQKLP